MKPAPFLIAVMLFISCNHADHTTTAENKFDIASVRKHIDEMNKTYGDRFVHNDTAFYAERYCKNASIMPEQMSPLVGRDSIRHFNYNDGKNKDFKIAITATNVYGGPDAVIEEGFYTFPGDDGVIYDKGKFIAIWKQEDGNWKLFREIWSTNNAPPAPVQAK